MVMDPANLSALKTLSIRADALRRAMDSTMTGSTPDHGKWVGFKSYARAYNEIAQQYQKLSGQPVSVFQLDSIKNWGDMVWPEQKAMFDAVYVQVLMISSLLANYDVGISASISEIQDMLFANLRKVIFSQPEQEIEIQNAIEALLVGRGMQRGVNYDRESGKVKFSGKEFIPDFVFPSLDMALEAKLIKEPAKISRCVEEMSADIPAYLSKYKNVLFCVYDTGVIRDVAEFQSGFERQTGVRICVVKH